MQVHSRLIAAALICAAFPMTGALAQDTGQTRASPSHRLTPDARSRLEDGRIAAAKAALKLSDEQLKLWGPVEAQVRASFARRQSAMAQRQQQQQSGGPLSLPDRLDRASQRMSEGAERLKVFNAAFRPFYASLNDEQKAVAGVVLQQMRGHRGEHGHRWAMHRAQGATQQ